MFQWHIVNSVEFHEGVKVPEDLYFLSDTGELYRGEQSFSKAVVEYTGELPTESVALNRLYINTETFVGSIYNGSEWKTVIDPVTNSINSLSWDSAEHILTVKNGSDTEDIVFAGLGVSLSYVGDTGTLQLLDAQGEKIGDPVELAKDKFVTAGEYDPETNKIILYFDAEKTNSVSIDAAGLVDIYTGESTSSVDVQVSTDNKITAEIKVSTEEGNVLLLKDDGIYVATPDMSDLMSKVIDATEGHIATFDANGQVVDSGKSIEDLAFNADGKTITLDGNVFSLKDFGTQYYAYVPATEDESASYALTEGWKAGLQPRVIMTEEGSYSLAWYEPSSTTVEGLNDIVSSIQSTVDSIESQIGNFVTKDALVSEIDSENPSAEKVVTEAGLASAMSWIEGM